MMDSMILLRDPSPSPDLEVRDRLLSDSNELIDNLRRTLFMKDPAYKVVLRGR